MVEYGRRCVIMNKKNSLKKAEQLERREERRLLKEYAYLEKLKHEITQRNRSVATTLATKIRGFESKIERIHNRILETLKAVKADGLERKDEKKLEQIEEDINLFKEDLKKRVSGYKSELNEYINQERWDELECCIIDNLKQDIKDWLSLDKKLIEFEQEAISDIAKEEKFGEHMIEYAETVGTVYEKPEPESTIEITIVGSSKDKLPQGKSKKEIIEDMKKQLSDAHRYKLRKKR